MAILCNRRAPARRPAKQQMAPPSLVVASGLPPAPPAAFSSASYTSNDFEPPLKKETPSKVLSSGLAPQPPPIFNPAKSSGTFDPPLNAAKAAKTVVPRKPKVLASGSAPKPPAAFESGDATNQEFDPPLRVEDAQSSAQS